MEAFIFLRKAAREDLLPEREILRDLPPRAAILRLMRRIFLRKGEQLGCRAREKILRTGLQRRLLNRPCAAES